MRTHHLKCWPEPFEAVITGRKKHEFRWNKDRGFAVGDELVLEKWDPHARVHMGPVFRARVTYLALGFGVPEGFCVMSIEPVEAA